jgi:spermidine/putrescine transport system ATP-binding protein
MLEYAPVRSVGSTAVVDAEPDIRLERVTKRFGEMTAVDALDLEVPRGAFYALLGPSGCGKTTTLRMVGGFEDPTDGRVFLGGDDVTERPPYKRDVNTVFQSYALFPHLTVEQNVSFGLERRKVGKDEVRKRVAETLDLVQLGSFGRRKPGQLSGGQAQRVSLARALVSEPDLLLLDEPFSALDALTRIEMHSLVTQLWERHEPAILLVTHDVDEALALADRVLVLDAGVVAREWEVPVRRTARSPEHHEIAQLREEVLGALGVSPGHEARSAEPHQFARNTETERSGAA